MNLIIVNGPDLSPAFAGKIGLTYDYTGTNAITLASALAAGGSLITGEEYFYKVVAVVKKGHVVLGDDKGALGAAMMSDWRFFGHIPEKMYWRFVNPGGGVRAITITSDPNGQFVLAAGQRMGAGTIILAEQNSSGLYGSVTCTATADDAGNDNIILTKYNYYEGNEETSETIIGGTQTVSLSWDPIEGDVVYRIYRGMATGVYDGFFITTGVTFSDDGTSYLSADELINKADVQFAKGIYEPATSEYAVQSKLYVKMYFGEDFNIDLTKVTNQPTWNLGTAVSTLQAQNDFPA